ncbi:MAG: Z1 domain-containing protein [Planctomycetota bacterium]
MPLDGEAVEQHLRVVRVQLDAGTVKSLDEALQFVPAELRDRVQIRYEEEVTQPILPVRTVSASGGPREWARDWDASEGYYWRRQREYLLARPHFTARSVESLDDASDTVLSHIEDPRPDGPDPFDVRGLVMGYVQSGKTANFCALIAKAADLGYKFVIVLSGIHNSLRQQTQRRVNVALGITAAAGSPPPEAGRRWISLTQDAIHGDFRPGTTDNSVLQGNERVVAVIKKNKSVLNRLLNWIENAPSRSLPVLIIDDEADQASINTGGNRAPSEGDDAERLEDITDLTAEDTDDPVAEDEINPSVINGLIRRLVQRFRRVSYIAYTATPFANVLIDHEATDREAGEDLYPRDFIMSLPRPAGYVGAEALFGRDALPDDEGEIAGIDVFREIDREEADEHTPRSRDIPAYRPRISPSLGTAFHDFVLATAAREFRDGASLASTMLIHTHHRTPVQTALANVVREHVAQMRQSWRYDRDAIEVVLRARWESEFRPLTRSLLAEADIPFEELRPQLDQLFRDPLQVFELNSASDDVLDYEEDPEVKAIVIGGNRLSRGLTLEGLLVSYYVREANAYDTLMQMGRWFGYREHYVDLTRIYTTERLFGWFRDLALAEAELRDEMQRYERDRLTPQQLGMSIRSHPQLPPTASNKLGSGVLISRSYSSRLVQTTYFDVEDPGWLRDNTTAVAELIAAIGQPNGVADGIDFDVSKPTWMNVSAREILAFLERYRTDPRAEQADTSPIRQYIHRQNQEGELLRWWVSIRGRTSEKLSLGTESRWTVGNQAICRINRSALQMITGCIGSLINPATKDGEPGKGDEEVGLTRGQIEAAKQSDLSYGLALRRQRSPEEGLLLIYPISSSSAPSARSTDRVALTDPPRAGETVAGIALAFPQSESAASIEYIAGSVEQLRRGADQ